jgi:hypothetical protein
MLAISLVFGSFIILLFFVVGLMLGWTSREYLMNYQDKPKLHPEFFDQHGNVIPDEVVAVTFQEGFFDDDDDEEDDTK